MQRIVLFLARIRRLLVMTQFHLYIFHKRRARELPTLSSGNFDALIRTFILLGLIIGTKKIFNRRKSNLKMRKYGDVGEGAMKRWIQNSKKKITTLQDRTLMNFLVATLPWNYMNYEETGKVMTPELIYRGVMGCPANTQVFDKMDNEDKVSRVPTVVKFPRQFIFKWQPIKNFIHSLFDSQWKII